MNTPTRTRHDDATTPAWYVATGRATEKRQGTGNNTLAETVEKYNHGNNTRIRLFAAHSNKPVFRRKDYIV